MQSVDPAEAILGRATGVLFFAGFGSLWLCTGLSAMHRLNILSGVAAGAILAILVIPAMHLLQDAPQTRVDNARQIEMKRVFGRVNTIQWIAIVAAIVLLNMFQQTDFIVPAIATIVGLHLFPLARLFRYPAHYVTGTVLVVWSAAVALVLRPQDIASVGAVGTAVILLTSAAYTLIAATRAASMRRPSPVKYRADFSHRGFTRGRQPSCGGSRVLCGVGEPARPGFPRRGNGKGAFQFLAEVNPWAETKS